MRTSRFSVVVNSQQQQQQRNTSTIGQSRMSVVESTCFALFQFRVVWSLLKSSFVVELLVLFEWKRNQRELLESEMHQSEALNLKLPFYFHNQQDLCVLCNFVSRMQSGWQIAMITVVFTTTTTVVVLMTLRLNNQVSNEHLKALKGKSDQLF